MSELASKWRGEQINDLFCQWPIPGVLWRQLQLTMGIYLAKAINFEYSGDEGRLIRRLDGQRDHLTNVTPNGGVVPKTEYQLEYNLFLRTWCDIVRAMVAPAPELLCKFRITPNIRIKFGKDLEENVGRPLHTAVPHSDAWVEGPWGMNCHIPVFGDIENNYLYFYKLIDEAKFTDDILANAASYSEMQWVMDNYEPDTQVKPMRGCVNLSDYALLHKTFRRENCGTRVSIDTTILIGNHGVHPDRVVEYLDFIPHIGEDMLVRCNVSVNDEIREKASTYSHYTSGVLERINI